MAAGPAIDRPLGGFERQFWAWGRIGGMNAGVAARLRGDLDPEAVRGALHAVQARHPLLRARIVHRGGPRWAEGAPPAALRVAPRDDDRHWERVAMADVDAFFPDEGPMLRAVLLRGQRVHDLVVLHHHGVADGFGSQRIVSDLMDALAGRPLAPVADPGPHEALLPAGVAPPPKALALAKFLLRLAATRPVRMPREGEAPPSRRRTGMMHTWWPEDATTRLVQRAKAEGATVTGALAAALQVAVAEELAPGRAVNVGWACQADFRGPLKVGPEVLGCYAFGLPYIHAVRGTFWDLARAAAASVQASAERGDALRVVASLRRAPSTVAGAAERLDRLSRLAPFSFGLSNMARLAEPAKAPGLDVEALRFYTGLAVAGAGVSLSCWAYRGRITTHLFYPTPLVSEARARRIHDAALGRLREATA